jgi:hypothetical protein
MPYQSEAQRRKFHELLKQGKISKQTVDEFDSASRGLKLPERVAVSQSKHLKPKYSTAGSKK